MDLNALIERPGNILIVDDALTNLQVLKDILKGPGHKVRPVPSGKLALMAAEAETPDLILLDIMMPEMDGYEVCRQLKAHPILCQIPVIFISALDDTEAKLKGFRAGGVDYIAKPFQAEEVLARVEAHLSLHYFRSALAEKTRQLEDSYDRLRESEHLRNQLTHMIVHDMRNLFNAVMGYLHLLKIAGIGAADEKSGLHLNRSLQLVAELNAMATNLLDIGKLEAKEIVLHPVPCDIAMLAAEVMEKMEGIREERDIRWEGPDQPVTAVADRGLLLRVMLNLLDNAIKCTAKDGVIALGAASLGDRVRFFLRDNGPGIPERYREMIFTKFGQIDLRREDKNRSSGLGLAFCKLAIEAHQGRIWAEGEVGVGSTFVVELPVGSGKEETCLID